MNSGDFMNTPLDELFSLYCMQNLQMPPNFHEFPHYPALARGLSHKQRRASARAAGIAVFLFIIPKPSPPYNTQRPAPCAPGRFSFALPGAFPTVFTNTSLKSQNRKF